MIKVKKDLTGKKFERLTVIKQVEDYVSPKGQRQAQWLCECDCDNKTIITVRGCNLISGNTVSCGCWSKEIASNIHKKYNTYDLSGEYGIGYTSKGEEFYFDLEDYDKIKKYSWSISANGYVKSPDGIFFHRLVMDSLDADFDIDHRHGENTKNDNRKENLRIATRSQNNMNRKKQSNNTSGTTGIHYDKSRNKWVAQIALNGKHHLKRFDKFDDAINQRKEWEEKYFAEFSYDNSRSS